MNLNNASAVGHRHLKLVAVYLNGLTARWQVAEGLHHQTADGIYFFIAEVGAKGIVKIFDRRQRTHGPCVTAELAKFNIIFFVVLIFDLAEYKFKNIINIHKTTNKN